MQWSRFPVDRKALGRLVITIVLILIADVGHVMANESMYSLHLSGMPMGQVIFLSSAVILVSCCIALGVTKPQHISFDHLLSSQNKQVWYRAISTAVGFTFVFESLNYISMDEALSILHIRALFTGLACWIYTKDRFSGLQSCVSFLSLCGVWSILQPEYAFPPHPQLEGERWGASTRFIGFCLAILSLISSTADYTFTRRIGSDVDVFPMILASSVCAGSIGLIWTSISRTGFVAASGQQTWTLLLLTMSLVIGQYTLIWAIRRETAAKIATLGHLQVVGSVIFHRWLIARLPPFGLVIKMVFMLITALVTAFLGAGLRPISKREEQVELGSIIVEVTEDGVV